MELVDGAIGVDTLTGTIFRRQGNCLYMSKDGSTYTLLADIPIRKDTSTAEIKVEHLTIKFVDGPTEQEEEELWNS